MKSIHEIEDRINQLQNSQKNGLDNSKEIDLLECLIEQEYNDSMIQNLLELYIKGKDWTQAKICIWILEESINPGW